MAEAGSIILTRKEALSLLAALERKEVEDGENGFSKAQVNEVQQSLSSGQIPSPSTYSGGIDLQFQDTFRDTSNRATSNADTIKSISPSLSSKNLMQMITELRIALRDVGTEAGTRNCAQVKNVAELKEEQGSSILTDDWVDRSYFRDACGMPREVQLCDSVFQGVQLLFKNESGKLTVAATVTEIVYKKSEIKTLGVCIDLFGQRKTS